MPFELSERQKVVRQAFKEWVKSTATFDEENQDYLDDLDWRALSVGFFVAQGLTIEEAADLATCVRYTDGYWTGTDGRPLA